MKLAIIPDIHGRTFWMDVKNIPDLDKIIFLGDYCDPYGSENISRQDCLDNFKQILEFKKENPDKVVLLLGNHDGQILGWSKTTARYDPWTAVEFFDLFAENYDLFKLAHQEDNILFTHAGVSETWLKQHDLNITSDNICNELNKMLSEFSIIKPETTFPRFSSEFDFDANPEFATLGIQRGGFYLSGGPTWCDVREIYNCPAYENELIQIFGHTQLEKTGHFIHNRNFYMCDSRSIFIYENNNLTKYGKN